MLRAFVGRICQEPPKVSKIDLLKQGVHIFFNDCQVKTNRLKVRTRPTSTRLIREYYEKSKWTTLEFRIIGGENNRGVE